MKLLSASLFLAAACSPSAVTAFAPQQSVSSAMHTSPTSPTALNAVLEKMPTSQLKKLIKATNPPRGTLRKLSTRNAKITFLRSKEPNWSNQKGGKTFGISLDSVGDQPFRPATTAFPGALTNADFCTMIQDTLQSAGYDPTKTLVATSLCCDEVNRPLETDLSALYDTNFNMGGLAGFPFGGVTSFGAMAAHIPDGGNCAVVYGPHVGVDSDGSIGTVERRGRANGGACCGSAVAAAGYVASVADGGEASAIPDDALDAQQAMVGQMLLPYSDRLADAGDAKMRELPLALYDAQTKLMSDIVNGAAAGVGENGKIALIGGVQINTPPGYADYFLPLKFEICDNTGKVVDDLLPNKPFDKVEKVYPGALTNSQLIDKITDTLTAKGYDTTKMLAATSLCCDEVNRPLETELSKHFDTNFHMGGLAGFPFGGATSFGAMASHIPDGGSCLVVYGPHVGVDSQGVAGTVERRGRENGGACCGSAVAASGYVSSVFKGEAEEATMPDISDAQQFFVGKMLLPYAERLDSASETMVELPLALYDAQSELIERIVTTASGAVSDGTICVVGGVQINTPEGYADYFLPKSFAIYDNSGKQIESDLL